MNALCRARIVDTSPYIEENADRVVNDIDIYACKRGDETEIEIFETSANETEDKFTKIINFKPDAAILLLDSSRDVDIHSQLVFFENLKKEIEKNGANKLPLIVAITKVDEASV